MAVLFRLVTSYNVAGSIPDVVFWIFHWHNPSGRTISLGLTQSLTETSNRNFLGIKAAGSYGWQRYHHHVNIVLKCENLKLLELSVPVQGCNGIALLFFVWKHSQRFVERTNREQTSVHHPGWTVTRPTFVPSRCVVEGRLVNAWAGEEGYTF